MGSIKALSLATVVALGSAGVAGAADLLPPPPMPMPAPIPVALDTSGWYIRADVGVGVDDSYNFRSTLDATNPAGGSAPPISRVFSNIGGSAIFGLGFGYQINNWFRADITGEYRTAASYRAGVAYVSGCGATYCLDTYTANVWKVVGLVNGYVDLGTWYGLTPFIGAGVGLAYTGMNGLTDNGAGNGFAADSKKTSFAWAIHAGVGYWINERLKLEASYRYLNTGTFTSNPIICEATAGCFFEQQSFKSASHDFRVGMRWMFADAAPTPTQAFYAPPPMPGPLVRKY